MHSFVARLRSRAVSQTTTLSTVSDDTPITPEPQQSERVPSVSTRPEHVAPVVLGRKILPHVHELMDSFEAEQDRPQGLSPPPSATKRKQKAPTTRKEKEEDRRSIAHYPSISADEDAIPVWTQPKKAGNWDEVSLV